MAILWINMGLPYVDGDPLDETLLETWDNNITFLKLNISSSRYTIAIEDGIKGNDYIVESSRDWRETLIAMDGYFVGHWNKGEPAFYFPGGSKDNILASSTGLTAGRWWNYRVGMLFYSASGGANYNSANMARAEWYGLGPYFDSSFSALYFWVDSTTGYLMARFQAENPGAVPSPYSARDGYDVINCVITVRGSDNII